MLLLTRSTKIIENLEPISFQLKLTNINPYFYLFAHLFLYLRTRFFHFISPPHQPYLIWIELWNYTPKNFEICEAFHPYSLSLELCQLFKRNRFQKRLTKGSIQRHRIFEIYIAAPEKFLLYLILKE